VLQDHFAKIFATEQEDADVAAARRAATLQADDCRSPKRRRCQLQQQQRRANKSNKYNFRVSYLHVFVFLV
jgi:hypothetical protein